MSTHEDGSALPSDREAITDTLGRELSAATVTFHAAVADSLGLSATDQKALDLVYRRGRVTAGELAEATGHTSAAATGTIDRLERGGFVRRGSDPTDRRKVVVTPVEERMGEVFARFAPLAEAIQGLAASYDDEQLSVVHGFLQQAVRILEEQTARLRAQRGGEGRGGDA